MGFIHIKPNRNNSTNIFFNGRMFVDTQRQVSTRDQYMIRKYSNMRYVKRIILAYKNLTAIYSGLDTNGKMNHRMRYGLPSKDQTYIVSQYDKLCAFVKRHSHDKPNSSTRKLCVRLEGIIYTTKPIHHISKVVRYNLNVPTTMEKPIQESYNESRLHVPSSCMNNGQRIHIPLKEVL